MRVTRVDGKCACIHAMRCDIFTRLLDLLKDRMAIATLANQHLVIMVLANHVLLDGVPANLEVQHGNRHRFDLVHDKVRYELKTKSMVDDDNIQDYLIQYHREIIAQASVKHRWLLAFLLKRGDAKTNKRASCKYYLLLVEIDARRVVASATTRQALCNEVSKLSQELKEKLADEDDMGEGIFFPVDNVFIVDALRDEIDELRDEKERLRDEGERLRDELGEKDREIARLRRLLAGKDG